MTRWIALVGATIVAGLGLPGAALAGTYTWGMPSDFTAAPPGANPDHDGYGGTPWSYAVYDGSTPASLNFSTTLDGGLSGWSDGSDGFLAKNTTGSTIGGVPAGGFAMQPPPLGSVTMQWLSPLAGNVSVTGSVTQANPGGPTCGFQWALSSNSTIVAHGGSGSTSTISSTVAVQPGTRLLLYVQDGSSAYSASCVTALASLTINASSGAPAVTLTSPSSGSTVSGQPTFSGTAGGGFGTSSTVAVRVYNGSDTSGSPVETLTSGVSGGSYSAATDPPLASGTYTAQAEQDDLAGDRGLSPAVTFTVSNVPPNVTLTPVTTAFTTSTPTLTGTAGTSSEDDQQVYLGLYAGTSASGRLVRLLPGTRAANGSFAIKIAPGLADGFYTAVAGQSGLGGSGFSSPVIIEVKVHPPALTFDRPADGAAINVSNKPVFSGTAGRAVGDYPSVRLVLYSGPLATGKPIATVLVPVKSSSWSLTWPGTLKNGFYSAVVQQADNAGHIATQQNSFLVTVLPHVIGYVLNLDKRGDVAIKITCPAEAGWCAGDVLAVTSKRLQPVRGGPTGRVRLLFVHVRIRAGHTSIVSRRLTRPVVNTLRTHSPMQVRVGAILTPTVGQVIRVFRFRLLSVA